MFNPFGMGSARQGFGQQGSNQPYDFKGLESRLGKIETGIAGLTEQFGNFQMPGQETVQPEYTGNTAPDPLTTAAPAGGIQSLPTPQDTGFNFDPQGITTDQWGNESTGNLQAQLSQAYGGQTHNEQIGRGPAGFTQEFADFFTGEGYYADPRGTYADAPWRISDKPIDVGSRMGGVLNPYGYAGSFTGNLAGIPQTDAGWGPQQLLGLGGGRERPGWTGQPQQQQALQAGVGSLQGPTQQKIQQGLGSIGYNV